MHTHTHTPAQTRLLLCLCLSFRVPACVCFDVQRAEAQLRRPWCARRFLDATPLPSPSLFYPTPTITFSLSHPQNRHSPSQPWPAHEPHWDHLRPITQAPALQAMPTTVGHCPSRISSCSSTLQSHPPCRRSTQTSLEPISWSPHSYCPQSKCMVSTASRLGKAQR